MKRYKINFTLHLQSDPEVGKVGTPGASHKLPSCHVLPSVGNILKVFLWIIYPMDYSAVRVCVCVCARRGGATWVQLGQILE